MTGAMMSLRTILAKRSDADLRREMRPASPRK
jgi:hypothetical protein